jgi:hypothetical protein
MEYQIGGSWGDAIFWSGNKQFVEKRLDGSNTFACHGWKRRKPEVGDRLVGEFIKSWVTFEFVEVQPCSNPPDMFFAKVRPIHQQLKYPRHKGTGI